MTGVLDVDLIHVGVIDTVEQLLQRYVVCMYYIVDCVWLGCHKCLTRVLQGHDIKNEGVIDTIEQLLQRYDVCIYCLVNCVWLGCHKCLTRVLQGHDSGVRWRHYQWRCDRYNKTNIAKLWRLHVL